MADPGLAEQAATEVGRRAEPGPDGRLRCPWALGSVEYRDYHDDEWGRPVRDDQGIFERLCLEAFQSGLSWLIILRKRENFRAAFRGFDIAAVAAFGPADEARLLGDAGIVRNRAKIEAVIRNARAAQALPGGLAALVWQYADAPAGPDQRAQDQGAPASTADIPSWTPASKALSRELRRCGFSWTGPVTAYATLQACGVVDDHLLGCFRRGAYSLPAGRAAHSRPVGPDCRPGLPSQGGDSGRWIPGGVGQLLSALQFVIRTERARLCANSSTEGER